MGLRPVRPRCMVVQFDIEPGLQQVLMIHCLTNRIPGILYSEQKRRGIDNFPFGFWRSTSLEGHDLRCSWMSPNECIPDDNNDGKLSIKAIDYKFYCPLSSVYHYHAPQPDASFLGPDSRVKTDRVLILPIESDAVVGKFIDIRWDATFPRD